MASRHRRCSILPLILEAWVIPCHAFNVVPPQTRASLHTVGREAPLASNPAFGSSVGPALGKIKRIPCLRMSNSGRPFFENFDDDYPSAPEDDQVL